MCMEIMVKRPSLACPAVKDDWRFCHALTRVTTSNARTTQRNALSIAKVCDAGAEVGFTKLCGVINFKGTKVIMPRRGNLYFLRLRRPRAVLKGTGPRPALTAAVTSTNDKATNDKATNDEATNDEPTYD